MIPPSPNQPPPDDLAAIRQVLGSVADRARSGGRRGVNRISSLVAALELGEIQPVAALAELFQDEAEIVRKVALGCLAIVAARIGGGPPPG